METILNKAKRYDEAIERAKEMIKAMTNIGGVAKVDDIQYLFPELKESEDERIRKYLKRIIGEWSYDDLYAKGFRKENMIAWIEKQGEQKSAWSEDDERIFSNINLYIRKAGGYPHFDEENIQEAINWLKSLKDRVQPQPKQEWSEEDKTILCYMEGNLEYLKNDKGYSSNEDQIMLKRQLDWLKDLKDRYTWKPSDEQMSILWDAIVYVEGCNSNFKGSGSVLENLYNDLKKLKE